MTSAEFKAIVEANGGESKLIAIGFDNSANMTFVKPSNPFTYAEYLMEDIDCLKMPSHDIRGNNFWCVKHLDNIQSICFADQYHSRTDYESQTVSG